MNSSRKRSAASAFGGSEELPASADSSISEDTDNDAQPTSKLISKIQAVELLTTLIQFVPNEYSEGSAVAEKNGAEAADNAEIEDIKILSQFKLRYLCRRFRNIIHRGLPLKLHLTSSSFDDGGKPNIYITDRFAIKMSRGRPDDELSGLVSSSLKTLPECVGSVHAVFVYSSPAADRPNPSIASTLSRYSQTFIQPYTLCLSLVGSSASAVKCFVKDFGIPFQCLFPNVTLDKLRFFAISPATHHLAAERDCLKYFLQFSSQSLVELHVDFRVLSLAFVPRGDVEQLNFGEDATNVCTSSLPTDWACNSLRSLRLCSDIGNNDYDYRDANLRAASHADFAKLRRWFPNITKLSFKADRPQIDSAVLNEFADLRKFSLSSKAATDELRADSNLVPLANIESFRLESKAALPPNFNVILPNVKKFKLVPQYAGAFADLANEVETVGNTFPLLQTFVVKQQLALPHESPPSFRDLVRLICTLDRLPVLNRLKVDHPSDCMRLLKEWSLPGDLSLVQVLPKKLTHVSFHCELLPPGATRGTGRNAPWSLCSAPEVFLSGESVYKNWLRSLLHLIVEHPTLEYFYCPCVAPQFEAIFALAEKWNRSSAKAIADLGLASVVHIQCSPVYTRMLETRNPKSGDRFKFRFVLSPPAELAGDASSSTKRKFVTVEFHNPN